MNDTSQSMLKRAKRFARIFFLTKKERAYLRAARNSGFFDSIYYSGAYPHIHPLFQRFALRHYIVFGEKRGFRPNPDFSPAAYLRHNPDVRTVGASAFYHWVTIGHREQRICKEIPATDGFPPVPKVAIRINAKRSKAKYAVVAHIYYEDLWEEFAKTLSSLVIEFDLYVTVTYRGESSDLLKSKIESMFPDAVVVNVANRGRDMLPFLTLVNSGVLDGYEAVCKIHTKKSPHRVDGEHWRRHLIEGILPPENLPALLDCFVSNENFAFWVSDGQYYTGEKWWGTNYEATRDLMRRVEIEIERDKLGFPAGSIYWIKPLIVGMLRGLQFGSQHFEEEEGQVDGTIAHALERAMGFIAAAAHQTVVQTSELSQFPSSEDLARPTFTSAFYLPQFHPIPENDAWWGKGFTEWRGVVASLPQFSGHIQPVLPADLGFYDLRVTEVMGEQAAMARSAGIDAFCVYHYWFNGRRVLEAPINKLLSKPQIDFPFYLCWANESWRRNWDGLSGEVLLEQTYFSGFEESLVNDSLPYLRDPRYSKPDGKRPRFVIYRPEDMPDPNASVSKMRDAWKKEGIDVELGAVCFHVEGENAVSEDLFDFWVEMPPHGIVKGENYLFGGPRGNKLGRDVANGFSGLIYDYAGVISNATSSQYVASLPKNTVCGVMPSWDNTARRGRNAHICYGANPALFRVWLRELRKHRLESSYRHELFINAWNEWAEKAVLEPSNRFASLYLDVLGREIRDD